MNEHYLKKMFEPANVALFGASDGEGTVGKVLLENLVNGQFAGRVIPINPKYKTVSGRPCFASLDEVHDDIDLAVIVTPADTVPSVIDQCGARRIGAAVVISAGFRETGEAGRRLEERVLTRARAHGIRVLGPNCLGLMRPSIGLNATFFKGDATRGGIALISQSGAVCTAVLDWAALHGVGFSSVVSIGDSADVDFGEVLDYVALDVQTTCVLLYIEGIDDARSFMSGMRAASRLKPVIVLKAGRYEAGSKAAQSHTGALVGSDDAYEAAFRRAGVVRVDTIAQLFAAAEVLSGKPLTTGARLAVVTNAGGPGVLAADAAARLDIPIASLSESTRARIRQFLSPHSADGNPVDMLGDASPTCYAGVVRACIEDAEVDALLVLLAPQAMTNPLDAARVVIDVASTSRKPIVACWMGGAQVREGLDALLSARIPSFTDPEAAVEAIGFLVAHRTNQQLLLQTPGALEKQSSPDKEGARMIAAYALEQGRKTLSLVESKAILAAFHIPVTPSVRATTAQDALLLAEEIGFPVAMKISSPDISHKSDVDGVALNIQDAFALRRVFGDMVKTVNERHPQAHIDGVTIEKMVVMPHARELMIGVVRDETFGPLISVGLGGKLVELIKDKATALPPLDDFIVSHLLKRTKAGEILKAFRNLPPANAGVLSRIMLRVSELVCEMPCIQEMDLNPVIVDEEGAVVVDARIVLGEGPPSLNPYAHLAIHPYPVDLTRQWQLADGTPITIRPIRPEDAAIEKRFVDNLSSESKYFRFMGAMQSLSREMLVRFTQIDYDREMALIAVCETDSGSEEIAVGRFITLPDGAHRCEFAIVVADAWQKKGLGRQIMLDLIRIAQTRGLERMEGEVLSENAGMLRLVRGLGFACHPVSGEAGLVRAVKDLTQG